MAAVEKCVCSEEVLYGEEVFGYYETSAKMAAAQVLYYFQIEMSALWRNDEEQQEHR